MSDEQLSTLLSIFPDKDTTTLTNALESSSGNLELATSMLISSTTVSEISSLREQFPDFKVKEIEQVFDECGKNADLAVTHLLDLQLLKQEKVNLGGQKDIESRIAKSSAKSLSEKNSDACWGVNASKTTQIQNLMLVPLGVAQAALFNNQLNVPRAIISIVNDYEKYQKLLPETKLKHDNAINPTTENMEENNDTHLEQTANIRNYKSKLTPAVNQNHPQPKRHGRVQARNGFQFLKNNVSDPETTISGVAMKQSQHNLEENFKHFEGPVFTLKNSKALELQQFVKENSMLKLINDEFMQKTYSFFNSNIEKCIEVLLFIAENHAVKYTHSLATQSTEKIIQNAVNRTWIRNTPIKLNSSNVQQGSNTQKTSALIGPNMFFSRENYQKSVQYMDRIFQDYRADFHGFRPEEATRVSSILLSTWWNEEVLGREMNNVKKEHSKVFCVSPYVIVTGRGIHSVGGVSKVRKAVKKLLDNQNYVYNEEASYFEVIGKKRS
ncbi:hypothetical protein ACO0QE_002024 [Hanseniaspora vineae]